MLASDASVFLRQYRELGLKQRLFARGSVATVEFLDLAKDNPSIGDGVIEATFWTAALDPEWEKRWLERWKTPVRVHGSLAALTFKYAVVPAVELALKKYGKADRKTIRDALEQLDVKDTPLGPIKFDDHHQAWINMVLIEMKGGPAAPPREDSDQPRHSPVATDGGSAAPGRSPLGPVVPLTMTSI